MLNFVKSFRVKHISEDGHSLGEGTAIGGGIMKHFTQNENGELEEKLDSKVAVLWDEVKTPSPSFHSPVELEHLSIDGELPTVLDCITKLVEKKDELEDTNVSEVIGFLANEFNIDVEIDDSALDEDFDDDDDEDEDEESEDDNNSEDFYLASDHDEDYEQETSEYQDNDIQPTV